MSFCFVCSCCHLPAVRCLSGEHSTMKLYCTVLHMMIPVFAILVWWLHYWPPRSLIHQSQFSVYCLCILLYSCFVVCIFRTLVDKCEAVAKISCGECVFVLFFATIFQLFLLPCATIVMVTGPNFNISSHQLIILSSIGPKLYWCMCQPISHFIICGVVYSTLHLFSDVIVSRCFRNFCVELALSDFG